MEAETDAAPGGRPPHQPTAELRDRVEILLASGMPAFRVAAAIGISVPTLRVHYADELLHARARREAQVKEALFRAALGGNVSAQKAWLAIPHELEAPPVERPVADRPAKLGKKEQAALAAETAADGTDWANLLPN